MRLHLYTLARLLHLADRTSKQEEFYAIKDKILSKNSKLVGYDLQHLEGKKCFTCRGTGVYISPLGRGYNDTCNRCWGGWYKTPRYVLLERKQFGKYIFHKPIRRWDSTKSFDDFVEDLQWQLDLPISEEPIEGYIERSYPKAGRRALTILFLLYNPRFWYSNWKNTIGKGWRYKWYWPRNWVHTIAHFIRYGSNAYPLRNWRERRKRKERPERIMYKELNTDYSGDDLPF